MSLLQCMITLKIYKNNHPPQNKTRTPQHPTFSWILSEFSMFQLVTVGSHSIYPVSCLLPTRGHPVLPYGSLETVHIYLYCFRDHHVENRIWLSFAKN